MSPLMLVALFASPFMALLDISVVTLALPDMQTDLSMPISGLQWVADAYAITLAALMLSAGTLSDRYGRKKVFLGGLIVFTAGSAACALAPSADWLIAARALQGIGASVLMPGAMSLIAHAFPGQRQRAKMLGYIGTVASSAIIVGPLLGGPLTEAFGWPSIFWINVPIGIFAVIVGVRRLNESASPDAAGVDPAGQLLAVLWVGALVYAGIEAGHAGLSSPRVVLVGVVGVVALAAFVAVELRQRRPMLAVRLFARPVFSIINLASATIGFGTFGSFYLLSLYLQNIRGESPTIAGLQLLPYAVLNGGAGLLFGRIVRNVGPRVPLLGGFICLTLAPAGLQLLTPTTPYPVIAVLFAVTGVGIGLGGAATNVIALHSVPPERSGMASATVNAARQVTFALGVAVLGAVTASGQTFIGGLHTALAIAAVSTGAVTLLLILTRRQLT